MTPRRLLLALLASIALVAALSAWHERLRAAGALERTAREQRSIAQAVASSLGERLAADGVLQPDEIAEAVRGLGCDGCVVLVRPPGAPRLLAADGSPRTLPALVRAVDERRAAVALGPADARVLGLPEDRAVAGLASATGPDGSSWGVAVLTSADRPDGAAPDGTTRSVLVVAVVAALLTAFGGVALVHARREKLLGEELAIVSARSLRAEQQVRAVLAKVADVVAPSMRLREASPPASLRDLEPRDIAAEASRIVADRFERAGVALRSEVGAAPRVRGDGGLLAQAVAQLLEEAADASPRGDEVVLRVGDRGGVASFEVVAPGALPPLVDATLPEGELPRIRGVLSEPIARMHGGAISVERAPGGGVLAAMTLPPVGRA